MERLRHPLFVLAVFALLLAACGPLTESEPVSQSSSQSPVNAQPTTLVPAPTDISGVSSLQQATIPNPPMQVGSLFRYFDGALLDAVPNDGPFLMGGTRQDAPQHSVTVSDFWIYSVEVSNQMYAQCVSVGKCTPPNAVDNPGYANLGMVNNPVVGVTWQQASDYCTYANGRLPTEAEWEKAASWDASLKQKRLYPWGTRTPTCDMLNYRGCGNAASSVTSRLQARSFYGVLNMAGNVFEWVADWYKPDYYTSAPAQDPQGPTSGFRRVVRSSGFGSDRTDADTSLRSSAQPSDHRKDLGFRCVVKTPTYFAPYCRVSIFYGAVPKPATPITPCPDPTIDQFEYCARGNKPVVNVIVHNTPPTIVTVTGLEACSPANNATNTPHQCDPGITIKVASSCATAPTGSSACPPGFSPDPNNPKQCVSPGGPGACPAGFQFDNKLQCCSATPGSAAVAPLCAAGQHLYDGVCVDDTNGPPQPASISATTIGTLTCTPSGK